MKRNPHRLCLCRGRWGTVFFLIHNIYSGELLQGDDDLLDVESTNSIVPDAKVLAAYAAEVVGKSERIEGAACLCGVDGDIG